MLPHRSILRLLIAAESKTYVYMVTEYCDGGELLDFVNENGPLDESLARCYFTQIVSGMKHIRDAGIVHRDLSPENILLCDGRSECKIM
jgi:serine/threonine protein kinase